MSEREESQTENLNEEIEGEAQVIEEAEVVEIQDTRASDSVTGKRSRGVPVFALVLSVIAVGGVGGGLYVGYQYWNQLQVSLIEMNRAIGNASREQSEVQERLAETRKAFEEQQQQMVSQKSALAEQQQLFSAQTQRLEQEQGKLEDQEQALRAALDGVHRKVGSSGTDWMAAEAAYLIRIANHRLHLERDLGTALKALEEADARLRDTGDPSWIGIREKLAVEMAAVKGVGRLDKAGLSARLSGMAEQVFGLKLSGLTPEREKPTASEDETGEAPERTLKTLLADSWEGFKTVMVIRHHQRPVTAMIAPEQQYFVYQNLRLQFEAARLAMLRGDTALYRSSIGTARQWLQEFFDPDQIAVQTLLAGIDELEQIDVAPVLPDISGSLLLLNERIAVKSSTGGVQ